VKLKKGDIVMLKNYFNGELSKFKRRFKGPFIIDDVKMEANEVVLKDKNNELQTAKVQDCLTTFKQSENKLESFNESIDAEADLEEEEFNNEANIVFGILPNLNQMLNQSKLKRNQMSWTSPKKH
jgi:hypothetical protein